MKALGLEIWYGGDIMKYIYFLSGFWGLRLGIREYLGIWGSRGSGLGVRAYRFGMLV